MQKNISLALLAMPLFLTGCTGTTYIKRIDEPTVGAGEVEGVMYYGYKMQEKPVVRDRIINPVTGELTHHAYAAPGSAGYCRKVESTQLVAVADYSKPFVIRYKPKWFETSKFSVALDKGMLSAVNTESTPGTTAVTEAISNLATARATILEKGAPAELAGSASTETAPTCSD